MSDPTLLPLFTLGGCALLSLVGLVLFGVIEGRRVDRLKQHARRAHPRHR